MQTKTSHLDVTALKTPGEEAAATSGTPDAKSRRPPLLPELSDSYLRVSTVCFAAALAIWYLLDNTWPFWDGASHVLDSITYRDLFRHPHVLRLSWWHDLLTVNFCYAPQLHAWFGILKVLLGPGLLAERLSAVLFCVVLCFSTFTTTLLVTRDRLSSVLAVVAINCFPLVMTLSHMTYLDYAYLSLYSLSMTLLLWWREKPDWKRAIILGVGLGLAASSKQVASFFLVGPCLALLAIYARKREWNNVLQLAASGLIAASFLAVWIIPNWHAMQDFSHRMAAQYNNPTIAQSIARNTPVYLSNSPGALSVILILPMLIGLFIQPLKQLVRFWPLALSAAGALFLFAFSICNPEQRYIAPVCVPAAALIGATLSRLMGSRFRAAKTGAIVVLVVALVQYITFCFTPYPISQPQFLASFPELAGIKESTLHSSFPVYHPTPPGDVWGQTWVIDTIKDLAPGNDGWLCVLPNTPRYNVHTFSLIARLQDSKIRPTTMRVWTLKGDSVSFGADKIENYDWYLFKTGGVKARNDKNERTKDKKSRVALDKFQQVVANSPRFQMFASRTVADGSVLYLYGKRSLVSTPRDGNVAPLPGGEQ